LVSMFFHFRESDGSGVIQRIDAHNRAVAGSTVLPVEFGALENPLTML
jgi:hypothetical protein